MLRAGAEILPSMSSRELPPDPPLYALDDWHALEPVTDSNDGLPLGLPPCAPAIVRDVQGRLWRVRPRPLPRLDLAGVLPALVVALVAVVLAVAYFASVAG